MKTRILQIGEGGFLRCYFDWMVQRMNDKAGFGGAVRIVQPRRESLNPVSLAITAQGGRYHVCLRGIVGGRRVEELERISCVKGVCLWQEAAQCATDPDLRFVVSNTTEAGIEYLKDVETFPSRLARLLGLRVRAGLPGLVFIPCELVEDNGARLRECILRYAEDWGDGALSRFVAEECVFCSTLVDRIVSGRPDQESAERYAEMLGERDDALVCGEPFHFLAVETPEGFDLEAEMPLKEAGVNVVYARDIRPYRIRKVRFLNAAHTSIALWGLERGFSEVAQIASDGEAGAFLRSMVFDEIYPTVELPDAGKRAFADSVLERFANPFAHHRLSSIALNSLAKWKTRCLPVVCDYFRLFGSLPPNMMEGYDAIARHFDSSGASKK